MPGSSSEEDGEDVSSEDGTDNNVEDDDDIERGSLLDYVDLRREQIRGFRGEFWTMRQQLQHMLDLVCMDVIPEVDNTTKEKWSS